LAQLQSRLLDTNRKIGFSILWRSLQAETTRQSSASSGSQQGKKVSTFHAFPKASPQVL
jgi:hypothetical protein